MTVLLLSPYPERLIETILKTDNIAYSPDPFADRLGVKKFDWIVSYGYRHILRGVEHLPPAVNLHISYLPWNKGADPNYWSWRDDTPKGVTIHKIDAGIDTGPVYAQEQTVFEGKTLTETYEELHRHICRLFLDIWPHIRSGRLQPTRQDRGGSYHRSSERPPVDWNTEVSDLDCLHGCGYIPKEKD